MTNLGQRVSSGVGSSRAANMDRLLHDALKRAGQLTLDGSESGLDLPSVVACSIVLELHPEVLRGRPRALRRDGAVWIGSGAGWHLDLHFAPSDVSGPSGQARLPGLRGLDPDLQSGHSSGRKVGIFRLQRQWWTRPVSAFPPLRSMMEATATGVAP